MKITLQEKTNLVTGRYHAAAAAESLILAYWDEERAPYHKARAAEAIIQMAEALGLVVTEKPVEGADDATL